MALEEAPDYPGALQLLLRRAEGVRLAPSATLSVPLAFDPRVIAEHHATVIVGSVYKGERLEWRFPVRGVVNAPLQLRAVRLAAKAKGSERREVSLTLAALAGLAPGGEDFTFEVQTDDAIAEALVRRSLRITAAKTRLSRADDALTFDAIFEPLRPFAASARLVVKRATGGRWPFEIQLDASDPDPDDVVEVEANLHATAKVQFSLVNSGSTEYAPFSAYFSTDSAASLSVSPSTGLLAPIGSDGTTFEVAFSPTKYGMLQRGRLVIQTDDMMWSYEVKGTHPVFVVPETTSKVDTHLSKKYLRK